MGFRRTYYTGNVQECYAVIVIVFRWSLPAKYLGLWHLFLKQANSETVRQNDDDSFTYKSEGTWEIDGNSSSGQYYGQVWCAGLARSFHHLEMKPVLQGFFSTKYKSMIKCDNWSSFPIGLGTKWVISRCQDPWAWATKFRVYFMVHLRARTTSSIIRGEARQSRLPQPVAYCQPSPSWQTTGCPQIHTNPPMSVATPHLVSGR